MALGERSVLQATKLERVEKCNKPFDIRYESTEFGVLPAGF